MYGHAEAVEYWKRAIDALTLAEVGIRIAPDGAANRAYKADKKAQDFLCGFKSVFAVTEPTLKNVPEIFSS